MMTGIWQKSQLSYNASPKSSHVITHVICHVITVMSLVMPSHVISLVITVTSSLPCQVVISHVITVMSSVMPPLSCHLSCHHCDVNTVMSSVKWSMSCSVMSSLSCHHCHRCFQLRLVFSAISESILSLTDDSMVLFGNGGQKSGTTTKLLKEGQTSWASFSK